MLKFNYIFIAEYYCSVLTFANFSVLIKHLVNNHDFLFVGNINNVIKKIYKFIPRICLEYVTDILCNGIA